MVRLSLENASRKWKHPLLFLPIILLILSLAFFVSCNDEPSGVQIDVPDNSGDANIDPGTMGNFLLASVEGGDFAFGRIEIWGYNLTTNPDSGTVSFDAVLVNASDAPVYPPIKFVVTSLMPPRVTVVNPSGFDRAGNPYFDFSDKLGDDAKLSPRERSRPFTFVFHTGTSGSFVIGYRFDFTWQPAGKMIVGAVFDDRNNNGIRERCEPGIPGVPVMLDSRSSGDGVHLKTITGENGDFRFGGLANGIYSVGSATPPGWNPTTPNPVLVTLTGDQENLIGVLFGFYNKEMPPPHEWTLFGPLYVGPMSRVGTELDSTFFVPLDSLDDTSVRLAPRYYLEVAYPPIMSPIPIMYDSALVAINGVTVYHFIYTGDPTFRDPIPGVFLLPDSLMQYGKNAIYIRVNGDDHASLQFRVFATFGIREDCY